MERETSRRALPIMREIPRKGRLGFHINSKTQKLKNSMKKICLYFEIHQIIHLKRYRFFDIGRDHYYYDDYENERSITDIAERSYVPALQTLIQMCKEHPEFKVAFSLSGVGLEQLEFHAPQVIDLLQEINENPVLFRR